MTVYDNVAFKGTPMLGKPYSTTSEWSQKNLSKPKQSLDILQLIWIFYASSIFPKALYLWIDVPSLGRFVDKTNARPGNLNGLFITATPSLCHVTATDRPPSRRPQLHAERQQLIKILGSPFPVRNASCPSSSSITLQIELELRSQTSTLHCA